ncbi:MAG TPA: nucleotide exchange factor GrpE [Candidatus Fournierella merdavium]|nr:nucleotide exchange factor GrpE [Candidatus Fournierella merdavium]
MDETNKRPEEAAAEAPAPEAEATEQKAAPKAEKAPEKEKKETKKDLEAQLAAARTEAEKARAEAEEAKDRLLRTAAEYDNFRKRSAREQDAAFGNGVAHAVSQILSILDALEMAEAAPSTDENFKKGVTLTLEKAKGAFEALKVEEIPALGLPFDPALHNAVMQKAAENGEESGTVLQVFQKGYKLGDRVIRHATVIVAE